jgi:hypothetical protein
MDALITHHPSCQRRPGIQGRFVVFLSSPKDFLPVDANNLTIF